MNLFIYCCLFFYCLKHNFFLSNDVPGKYILYHLGGNRFCARLQREHQSNHVMIVVELASGIFYQKCLDPECRQLGFQSESAFLPVNLIPFTERGSTRDSIDTQDEDILINTLDDAFFDIDPDDFVQIYDDMENLEAFLDDLE